MRIDRLTVDEFEPGAYPEATVTVECSSGTYIRSLAADLGVALGGCAHLAALRRLAVGSFGIDEAHTVEAIEATPDAALLTPRVAMRDLEAVVVGGEEVRAIAHGATFAARTILADDAGEGPFAVVDSNEHLLAVYERRGAGVKPAVVVEWTSTAYP